MRRAALLIAFLVLGSAAVARFVVLHPRVFFLTQEPYEAVVRADGALSYASAAEHADVMLDYALLSDQTYADELYEGNGKPISLGDGTYCADRRVDGQPCPNGRDLTPYARERLARWRRIDSTLVDEPFPCPKQRAYCLTSISGLGVQIWVSTGPVCAEAVIAFRGTDGGKADDWLSNLRWFTRIAPINDQYDQVQDRIGDFVARIKADGCYRAGRTRIVATGHSLGGGLAQQAAYAHAAVAHVYAFDPSFVTGYYDVAAKDRDEAERGLRIERAYEHGEVLAYGRFLLRYVNPLSTCNPEMRNIRFYTVLGDPIHRHALNSIATALLGWSKTRKDVGLPADEDFRRAGTCPAKEDALAHAP